MGSPVQYTHGYFYIDGVCTFRPVTIGTFYTHFMIYTDLIHDMERILSPKLHPFSNDPTIEKVGALKCIRGDVVDSYPVSFLYPINFH